jgi:hypothetical protein
MPISGVQFMPRASTIEDQTDEQVKKSQTEMTALDPKVAQFSPLVGDVYGGWEGSVSVAPHAAGAMTTADKAVAFRHQGPGPLAHGAGTQGSWLFKNS